jgi:hypothetical protein
VRAREPTGDFEWPVLAAYGVFAAAAVAFLWG